MMCRESFFFLRIIKNSYVDSDCKMRFFLKVKEHSTYRNHRALKCKALPKALFPESCNCLTFTYMGYLLC